MHLLAFCLHASCSKELLHLQQRCPDLYISISYKLAAAGEDFMHDLKHVRVNFITDFADHNHALEGRELSLPLLNTALFRTSLEAQRRRTE